MLKKHLKGDPKDSIGDDSDVTTIAEAFRILEHTYGNTRDMWDATVRYFEKKCNRPDIWEKEATAEKHQLVIKIKDFLRKALKYAIKYPALEKSIISQHTANTVYAVLPDAERK